MLRLFQELGFRPRRCTWEITLACNLRCGHCGSRAGKPREDELSTDEAFAVIDDLAELGCKQVTLAGGEPTLRRDWPELVQRFKAADVYTSIITNGMTWNEQVTARAKACGLDQVAFSLDGLADAHDEVRGVVGSFDKVVRGIEMCIAAGFPVATVTHITRRNLHQIEAMHALLAGLGVRSWQIQQGVPTGNLADQPDIVLPQEAMLELVARMEAIARSGVRPKIFAADNVGYYSEHEGMIRGAHGAKVDFWLGCRAGLDVVGIESHGAVKGCLSLPSELNGRADFIEGNVRERSFKDIWNDPNTFAYTRKFALDQLHGDCAGCAYGEICRGGCTVTSVGHTGKPHGFPNCWYAQTRERTHVSPRDALA